MTKFIERERQTPKGNAEWDWESLRHTVPKHALILLLCLLHSTTLSSPDWPYSTFKTELKGSTPEAFSELPGSKSSTSLSMATHSSILAWKIPWTEQPHRLQSMGSQGVRHNWVTSLSVYSRHPLKTFTLVFTTCKYPSVSEGNDPQMLKSLIY